MSTEDQYLLRPKQNPPLGIALRLIAVVAGIAAFIGALIFIFGAVSAATPEFEFSDWFNMLRYVLFFAVGGFFFLAAKAYGWFARWGKRHLVPFADDVLAKDTRPPIVYLRSFADEGAVRAEEES